MNDLVDLYSEEAAGARAAERHFREVGATSAATARAPETLPPIDPQVMRRLVDAGRLREGAPGTFYLYERARRGGWSIVLRVLLWLALLLVPILMIQGGMGR